MSQCITNGNLAATLIAAQNVGRQVGIDTSTWHIGTRGGTYRYLLREVPVRGGNAHTEVVAGLGATTRGAYDTLHTLMAGMRLVQQYARPADATTIGA